MEYAEWQFEAGDDMSVGDTPDPPVLVYIWHWFLQLSPHRDIGMGRGFISHREIDAWSRLYRVGISPSEIDAIHEVDAAYLKHLDRQDHPEKYQSISQVLGAAKRDG